MRRAHDRRREAFLAVGAYQPVPHKRSCSVSTASRDCSAALTRLSAPGWWSLIRRGGTDEDVARSAHGIAQDQLRHDQVRRPPSSRPRRILVAQRLRHRVRIAYVAMQDAHFEGNGWRLVAPRFSAYTSKPRSTANCEQAELMIPLPPMKRTRSPLTGEPNRTCARIRPWPPPSRGCRWLRPPRPSAGFARRQRCSRCVRRVPTSESPRTVRDVPGDDHLGGGCIMPREATETKIGSLRLLTLKGL